MSLKGNRRLESEVAGGPANRKSVSVSAFFFFVPAKLSIYVRSFTGRPSTYLPDSGDDVGEFGLKVTGAFHERD